MVLCWVALVHVNFILFVHFFPAFLHKMNAVSGGIWALLFVQLPILKGPYPNTGRCNPSCIPCGPQLGPGWALVGPQLGPSWAPVGPNGAHLGMLLGKGR